EIGNRRSGLGATDDEPASVGRERRLDVRARRPGRADLVSGAVVENELRLREPAGLIGEHAVGGNGEGRREGRDAVPPDVFDEGYRIACDAETFGIESL